jgi:hypothetical protein
MNSEIHKLVETGFEFPLTTAAVLEQVGEKEIEAPNPSESETVATILARSGEETYYSEDDLLSALQNGLSEEYIGRKYYDDRGPNPESQERLSPNDTDGDAF